MLVARRRINQSTHLCNKKKKGFFLYFPFFVFPGVCVCNPFRNAAKSLPLSFLPTQKKKKKKKKATDKEPPANLKRPRPFFSSPVTSSSSSPSSFFHTQLLLLYFCDLRFDLNHKFHFEHGVLIARHMVRTLSRKVNILSVRGASLPSPSPFKLNLPCFTSIIHIDSPVKTYQRKKKKKTQHTKIWVSAKPPPKRMWFTSK